MATGLSSSGGGGGGGGSLDISEIRIDGEKTAPAILSFRLSGIDSSVDLDVLVAVGTVESEPGEVEIRCDFAGDEPFQAIQPFLENPAALLGLTSSVEGTEHSIVWNFDDQFGDGTYRCIQLRFVAASSSVERSEVGFVGNDSPMIEPIAVSDVTPGDPNDPRALDDGEIVGDVQVVFRVSDTSNDRVSILAEYAVFSGAIPPMWLPATSVGTPLDDVQVFRNPTTQTFLWDAARDLPEVASPVMLRFVPTDGAFSSTGDPVFGDVVATPIFGIDNNARPRAFIGSDVFVFNPDVRRGIPVPFSVQDDEEDVVDVVFQWTRSGEEFPELGSAADLRRALADAEERQRLRIATEAPVAFGGRLGSGSDAQTARLSEVASSQAGILGPGGLGADLFLRELEVLRGIQVPIPRGFDEKGEIFQSPISARPLANGEVVLLLDAPIPGSYRLRRVRLGTGAVEEEVATGSEGIPSALFVSEDGSAILAIHSPLSLPLAPGGRIDWQLLRVKDGTTEILFSSLENPSVEPGIVRGIAPVGSDSILLTVGSSLVRLTLNPGSSGPICASSVLDGLDEPHGIVLDERSRGRVFVAERGKTSSGRVIGVDLNSGTFSEIRGQNGGFSHPTSLALELSGSRLLVVTDDPSVPGHELRSLDLDSSTPIVQLHPDPREPTAVGFEGEVGELSAGADGLRVLPLLTENDLAIGGGIEQTRTILQYDRIGQRITVDRPFDPPVTDQLWRIQDRASVVQTSAQGAGTQDTFVWDTRDVLSGGAVLLRVLPLDEDQGQAAGSVVSRTVRADLDVDACRILEPSLVRVSSIVLSDLDADGDLDIAVVNDSGSNGNVTVFFQENPGLYTPLTVNQEGGAIPTTLASGDLNQDGRPDLAVTNLGTEVVRVFFQDNMGTYSIDQSTDVVVPDSSPIAIALGDIDGDSDLDFVTANSGGNNLRIFFQTGPGLFSPRSQPLGGSDLSFGPEAVKVADVDGNGLLDVISGNTRGDNITIFYQDSLDEFSTLTLGSRNNTDSPLAVEAADVDGNGRIDLITANTDGNNLTVFLQADDRRFTPKRLGGASNTQGPSNVIALDFDRDGRLDLASANEVSGNLTVFFQTSQGEFDQDPLEISIPSPRAIASGDLSLDGAADLVSASTLVTGTLSIFHQTASRTFEPKQRDPGEGCSPVLLPETSIIGLLDRAGPEDGVVGDFDGDGDADIVTANVGGGNLSLLLQTSPGLFADQPVTLDTPDLASPGSVDAGDLDSDGDLDFVVSSLELSRLVILRREGGTYTGETIPLSDFSLARQVRIADVDGDGLLDVIASINDPFAPDSVTVYYNAPEEPSGFLSVSYSGLNSPKAVLAVDLDGNGLLDLLAGNEIDNSVTAFFQSAPRNFDASPTILASGLSLPTALEGGDVDGDGNLDVVVTTGGGTRGVTILLQKDSGSFEASDLGLGPGGVLDRPSSVDLVDLDRDGDLDVVVAGEVSENVVIFIQRGGGLFDPLPLVLDLSQGGQSGVLGRPRAIFATDLDGDGDLDVLTVNRDSDNVTVFYGAR